LIVVARRLRIASICGSVCSTIVNVASRFGGLLAMHFGVVRREEQYLEQKFGNRYRLYKLHVPRYGLGF